MNILSRKYCVWLSKKLAPNPAYQIYIHYKDHDKKINPKDSRLYLSFMDPKKQTDVKPQHEYYIAKLKSSVIKEVKKREFEDYKTKLLEGRVDQEQVVEPDPLWGYNEKPVHYYKDLSSKQVSLESHSIFKDVEHYQKQISEEYVNKYSKQIASLDQVKEINDLADLAAYYRKNNLLDRKKFYEIQQIIGNKFHLITKRSLILLKYAFYSNPKQSTPQFNRIINHLLIEQIHELNGEELTSLMYFNRFDNYKFYKSNLQIPLLEEVTKHFPKFTLEQKINFLVLFVDSRNPIIRPQSHNRYLNEIRSRSQEIIHYLQINRDLSQLSEDYVIKLAYSLVRARTNATSHITLSIVQYIEKNLQALSPKALCLFFVYLGRIESNKSIEDIQLLKKLKEKVINYWGQYSSLDKLRALDVMYNFNIYDQQSHHLYTQIPFEADSTMLSIICKIQMMNSSGREWQVIHKLVELDHIPLQYYQDYRRFYNYTSSIAPDWDLEPALKKLQNTEIFFDAQRLDNLERDKKIYSQIRTFQQFSGLKQIPKELKMGVPIKNVQFVHFALAKYQISIDIIGEAETVRGTRDIKGSYQIKIKNLQCIGWKHLYVFQQDVKYHVPSQLFEHLYSLCQPYFEEQLKLIASYEQYQSYQIFVNKNTEIIANLKPLEIEQYMEKREKQQGGDITIQNERSIKQRSVQSKFGGKEGEGAIGKDGKPVMPPKNLEDMTRDF